MGVDPGGTQQADPRGEWMTRGGTDDGPGGAGGEGGDTRRAGSEFAEGQQGCCGGVVDELGVAGFVGGCEVGRGGFGVVYRCTQARLGRPVAVKVLTVQLADNRARFLREQQAMGKLTGHRNIVAVLQVGETSGGHPFLVMPYCGHGCLQDRITEHGLLGLSEVLRVGVKIAAALASAHRVGVVHRDVKPANILLTDYDEPALCDFGIARLSDGDGFQTASGLFSGSPAFTAPEIINGAAPSPATDVYGLGATLFCALTGHAAFERRAGEQPVAQLVRVATQPAPDLRDYGIAQDVADVVAQAMARNPAGRPTAEQLGHLLQAAQARHGLPVDDMVLPATDMAVPRSDPPIAATAVPRPRVGGRLPVLPEGFIGRTREAAQVHDMVSVSRLVTMVGMGGIGKTTLATHAATELAEDFADGVWWIGLADLTDGGLLTEVVAGALGLRDQSGRASTDVLINYLADRNALLVLDNCEHLIGEAAKLVDTLLHHCLGLHILATSREILNITGETLLPLAPLASPDPELDRDITLSGLARYDAVALFVQRARAAVPDFSLTPHNVNAIARICTQLDGLPLAIELAAARLRAMSVEQIADGLSDRYALLTRGRRGAPTRQKSLADCIAWSYQLCTAVEQHLWRQLSIFTGSFTFDAAHHICADSDHPDGLTDDDLLDELTALVDKSILIRTGHNDGTVRFRLLDTVRDYGRTQLTDVQLQALRRHHAAFYHRLLIKAEAQYWSDQQIPWLHRLTTEMPNIRQALQFSLSDSPQVALEIANFMRLIWSAHGLLSEARRWVDLALAATAGQPSVQSVRATGWAALLAAMQGDLAGAETRLDQGRELLAVIDDPIARGAINYAAGHTALLRLDIPHANACFEQGLAATNDYELQLGTALFMGWLLTAFGERDRGLSYFEKCRDLTESSGESWFRAFALGGIGLGAWLRGQPERAEQLLLEGLRLSHAANNPLGGVGCVAVLGWVAAAHNKPRRAAVLMAAASAISRAVGTSFFDLLNVSGFGDDSHGRVREQLTPEEFEAAWAEGDSLDFDQAVSIALES